VSDLDSWLWEQLEQEAAAARQEAAQVQKEARMAQVCWFRTAETAGLGGSN
jgi:hypothetical protein